MSTDDKLRKTVWHLSLLVSAYLAGFGTYKAILEISKLDTVRADTYVKKDELESNYVPIDQFKNLQENMNQNEIRCQKVIAAYDSLVSAMEKTKRYYSQALSSREELKRKSGKEIESLIQMGSIFIKDKKQDFNFEKWKNDGIHVLETFDSIYGTMLKADFENDTKHTIAQHFLTSQDVEKGLATLSRAQSIMQK